MSTFWLLYFAALGVFLPMAVTIIRAKDFDPGEH